MPVSHFNIVGRPSDYGMEWENTTFTPDGTEIQSVEEWRNPSPDKFTYDVFRLEDGKKSPWVNGKWTRAT